MTDLALDTRPGLPDAPRFPLLCQVKGNVLDTGHARSAVTFVQHVKDLLDPPR